MTVALKFEGVLQHDDAEVVLGFSGETVGVDERVAVNRSQGIPLMHVTVHHNCTLVVVGARPLLRTRPRISLRSLRARPVELLPPSLDGVG